MAVKFRVLRSASRLLSVVRQLRTHIDRLKYGDRHRRAAEPS
jgi:hypothetical protein